jgi:hypothetical protein
MTAMAPRLLGVFPVREEPGLWIADLPSRSETACICVIECEGCRYPLERHMTHARHEGGDSPYTFSHFAFSPEPPGILVGPWPGWRGIPVMPRAEIRFEVDRFAAAFHFWGDERETGWVRLVARIPSCRGRAEIRIDDDRIVPVAMLLYSATDPLPLYRSLDVRHAGAPHPSALFEIEEDSLRERATGSHADLFAEIVRLLGQSALPFVVTEESKTLPGPECLGPQDEVVLSALVSLATGDALAVARALDAFGRYVQLTQKPGYEPLTIDTQCGETLFILCLGFDWLYPHFPDVERECHRERIVQVAELCMRYMGDDRRDFLQAHYLGVATGLLAFAILFRDEHPAAQGLLAGFAGVADAMMEMLPDDGSYPHGMNLWIYEHGFLLRFLEMMSRQTGRQYLRELPYFVHASRFRGATMADDGVLAPAFGDPQYRVSGDAWMHFLIAARTGSAEAQAAGLKLSNVTHEGIDFRLVPPRRRVYEFLFRDDFIAPAASQESVLVFGDLGQMFVRASDMVLTTRSGAPLGTRRYGAGSYGAYGHGDPANGSFLLRHRGHFVVCGPGPVYKRESRSHNIFTVNGKGQLGDGCVWLPDFFPPEHVPPVPTVERAGDAVVVEMDLAASYLPFLRVTRARRKLIIDPRNFIMGWDTIECGEDADIEWNLHSRGVFEIEHEAPFPQWGIVFPDARYRLTVYADAGYGWKSGLTEFVPAYPNDGSRDSFLRVTQRGSSACIVWALTWHP